MAEDGAAAAEFRVVRCPKCEKLLPELPKYSIYICGGCGATLQAKKQNPAPEASSEKSDGESVKYLEVLGGGSVKKDVVPVVSPEANREGTTGESGSDKIPPPLCNSASRMEDNGIKKHPTSPKLDGLPMENDPERRESNYRRVGGRALKPPMKGIQPNHFPDNGGPSDYLQNSRHIYAEGEHYGRSNTDGPSRVSHLERDRAELLRMLDELRDQVQRSRGAADKENGDQVDWLPQRSSPLKRNASRRAPSLNGNTTGRPTAKHDVHGYGEPIPHGRAPIYAPGHYVLRNHDPYGLIDPDPLISYHHGGFYHQPACSCLHCHHTEFPNHQRAPYLINDHPLYPTEAPSVFGLQSFNSRSNNGYNAPHFRNRQRTMFSKKLGKHCQPLTGGAPFTVCYNCYELLQIPRKSIVPQKNQFKMHCGACSCAIMVKLDASALAQISHRCSEDDNDSNASPGKDVQSTDEKLHPPCSFSADHNEVLVMQGFSWSSGTSPHQQSPNAIDSRKDVPVSTQLQSQAEKISRVPSLPLCEHFGYSLLDKADDGSGKGSRSTRSEQEKVILTENFKQNSIKDVRVATEMDLPVDEYPDRVLSQDSLDIGKDEGAPRTRKGGDSFLASLIKKSFKTGNAKSRVSINGYPVSDRSVKKAEKQAGPIYPGDYWYDYRAGFWGVMGHPCLGMIPPFIGELNYPMPKNCAGGNTNVLVNGRKLHQKDLDLLIGRGLPDTPGQSYRIEISGKVWDESSGEELYGLGKLAPTVERMRRGFGMRIPRAIT